MTNKPYAKPKKKNKYVKKILTAPCALLGGALAVQCAYAQGLGNTSGDGRDFSFEPKLSVSETYSNNIDLSSRNPRSDFLTEVSPGFTVSRNRGNVRGSVDYSLNQLIYANNSDKNSRQNALNANGVAELVDGWAYVDVSGTIAQQYISAFGTPSVGNVNINDNKTEVSSYKISPYVKGDFSTFATYEARYTNTITRSKSAVASDIDSNQGLFKMNSREFFNRLRWNLALSQDVVDYKQGRKTTSDVFRTGLSYPLTTQLTMTGTVGRESNNYVTVEKASRDFTGAGIAWNPLQTTTFTANGEKHAYGNTYNVSFEHRTPRTAWAISDSRNVSVTPVQQGVGSVGTIYDLMFAQFAAIEPDPIKRATLVSAYMRGAGIDPNMAIIGGYSTSGLSLQRTQTASFSLLGIRSTVTFTAIRTEGSSLKNSTGITGNFSDSQLVKQNGFVVNYSHRLTPDSTVSATLTQQASEGDSEQSKTKINSFGLSLSSKLGQHVTSNLGLRRVLSSGDITSYQETAVSGSLNFRF